MSAKRFTVSYAVTTLVVISVTAFSAPRSQLPAPPTSEKEAIARAKLNLGPAGMSGMRYDLPAAPTGTAPHDFFNLFSSQNLSSLDVIFGIGIASDRKEFAHGLDAQVSVGTDDGPSPIRLQTPIGFLDFSGKLQVVEGNFDRAFVERAAKRGARFALKTSRGVQEFAVPNWMFSALLKVADEHDFKKKAARAAQAKRAASEERRKSYVEAHPELANRIKEAIGGGSVVLGTSPEEARASWGLPDHVNRTVNSNGTHEQWAYGNTYVYFDNGVLTSWQDSQ